MKMKTINIPELNIQVELEETQKGTSFNEIKIKKGWRLLTGAEAMFIYENYRDKIKLDWFFVKPVKEFPVARFNANSAWASLYCNRYPGVSDSRLGVRFCRSLK